MTRFSTRKRRPNVWVIVAIVLIHLAVFYVLLRSLAPSAVATAGREILSVFDIAQVPPAPPPPPSSAPSDAGPAGDPGREAVPRPVTAPQVPQIVTPTRPAPRASSTGTANASGASAAGAGTGAGGSGAGTGAGGAGAGRGGGGVPPSKPVLLRDIRDASAFPVPPGGREARIGKSVIVRLRVSPEGRATACSVYRPSPFPETDAIVCRLALEQIRFEPARDAEGQPVAADFYYQQRFFN